MPAPALFLVNLPWVKIDAAHPTRASAFMELTSTDGAALTGVRSSAAEARLRAGSAVDNHRIDRLVLPAGQAVALKPDAFWIALSGLPKKLRPGDRVPLTLTIEDAAGAQREIEVRAEVRVRSALDDHRHGHQHEH